MSINTNRKINYYFGIFGSAFFLLGSYFFYSAYTFVHDPNTLKSTGTVVELIPHQNNSNGHYSLTYAPKISFKKADGTEQTFQDTTSSNPPAYTIGESVSVIYNNNEYKIDSFSGMYLFSVLFMGVGLLFGGIGYGGLAYAIHRRKQIELLKTNGTPVKAKVTEIIYNTSLKVNGRSPWKISAQSTDTALGISIFNSDNIWFNPAEFAPIGKEVTVFVNMAKPKQYWLDTSFLPKES